jgi:hypothetical protein
VTILFSDSGHNTDRNCVGFNTEFDA